MYPSWYKAESIRSAPWNLWGQSQRILIILCNNLNIGQRSNGVPTFEYWAVIKSESAISTKVLCECLRYL